MRKYEARVYEIEGKKKFPRMSVFNTSGPESAIGTHILFLFKKLTYLCTADYSHTHLEYI